jgi:hypothetical protein
MDREEETETSRKATVSWVDEKENANSGPPSQGVCLS